MFNKSTIALISGSIWLPGRMLVKNYSKPSVILNKLVNKTKSRRSVNVTFLGIIFSQLYLTFKGVLGVILRKWLGQLQLGVVLNIRRERLF